MCLMVAELAMLGSGLYALFGGNIVLSPTLVLRGRRSRIVGAFLIAPVFLLIVIRVVLDLLARSRANALALSAVERFSLIEIALVMLGLLGALVYVVKTEPPERYDEGRLAAAS